MFLSPLNCGRSGNRVQPPELEVHMFRKNKPMVLSATNCKFLEDLRMAVEVLTGQRVRFERIDVDEGNGRIFVGDELRDFMFTHGREDLYHFAFGTPHDGRGHDWHVARFETPDEVHVCSEHNPVKKKTVAGDCSVKWVGSSMADRREVPVFLRDMQYCADVRGMSLEDLLAGKESPRMLVD